MTLECDTGELLVIANGAFMRDDDKDHNALKHYAALKVLEGAGWEITPSVHVYLHNDHNDLHLTKYY